jgi:hypothetical protein
VRIGFYVGSATFRYRLRSIARTPCRSSIKSSGLRKMQDVGVAVELHAELGEAGRQDGHRAHAEHAADWRAGLTALSEESLTSASARQLRGAQGANIARAKLGIPGHGNDRGEPVLPQGPPYLLSKDAQDGANADPKLTSNAADAGTLGS